MHTRALLGVGGVALVLSLSSLALVGNNILQGGYSPRVHAANALLWLISLAFFLFSYHWLRNKQGGRWVLSLLLALVLSITLLIFLTGREELGAKVTLHLQEDAPVPRRLELSRGFPSFAHFLDHKVELSYDEKSRTFYNSESPLRCGQWILTPHPDFQRQPITIPSDGAKEFVESEVEFIPIWDGKPDSPSQDQVALNKPDPRPTPDSGGPPQKPTEEPEEVAPKPKPQNQELAGKRDLSPPNPPGISPIASPPTPAIRENGESWTRAGSNPSPGPQLPAEILLDNELAKAKRKASQYRRQGRGGEAIRVLADFTERYPNTPQAQAAREEIERYHGHPQ